MKPIFASLTPAAIADFWSRVHLPEDQGACWLWAGDCNARHGYGRFRLAGSVVRAHRVALTIKLGRDIAPEMQAQHLCDCKRCTNPSHLIEGSVQINKLHETIARRHAHGSRTGTAKLDEEAAAQAWARINAGEGDEAIASRLGVSHAAVQDIRLGRTWTHVTGLSRTRKRPLTLAPKAFEAIAFAERTAMPLTVLSERTGMGLKVLRDIMRGRAPITVGEQDDAR